MKKMNKKVMVLGGLVMAVVLTGYSVVGTYAKYTEKASVSDQATVAKWDVSFNTSVKSLFDTTKNNATVSNRVAPGGSDSAVWTLTGNNGASEVKVVYTVSMTAKNTVSLEITEEQYNTLVNAGLDEVVYTDADKYYYSPIVFTVNNEKYNALSAVETKVVSGSSLSIDWKWAYEAKDITVKEGTTATDDQKAAAAILIDELDTILGRKADPAQTVEVEATITAVQDVLGENSAAITPATEAEIQAISTAYGYDAEYTKDVVFSGNKLTGTIRNNTNSADKLESIFPEETADGIKGYYYPVVLKGVKVGATVTTINVATGVEKTHTFADDKSLEMLFILNANADDADKKIIIKTTADDGETETTTTIDYSELNFAE